MHGSTGGGRKPGMVRRLRHCQTKGAAPAGPRLQPRRQSSTLPYIPTLEGWLYLADLLDCCSRKVVGWSLADHLRTDLPLAALRMAITARRPSPGRLVHHSDRGSQYTSAEYQNELAAHGITASMSRRGNCFDNAVAESFFATLKAELVHRCLWLTKAEAARAIFEWIEVFYNRQRLHSTLGNRTPEAYEREVRPTTAA